MLMLFHWLTLMLTLRVFQFTPPHIALRTPIAVPHQIALPTTLQPNPHRGGGGKKKGGYSGCHQGPNMKAGL